MSLPGSPKLSKDNGTARWFCGHLWETPGHKYSMRRLLNRLSEVKLIRKIGFQIEAGNSQHTLHYQYLICTEKPVRNTQLFKAMNCRKGEMVIKVNNLLAQKNYIAKESTKVEGPWYFERSTVPIKAPCGQAVLPEQTGSTMDILLAAKFKEIMMWTDFIHEREGSIPKYTLSHGERWREIDNPEKQF